MIEGAGSEGRILKAQYGERVRTEDTAFGKVRPSSPVACARVFCSSGVAVRLEGECFSSATGRGYGIATWNYGF